MLAGERRKREKKQPRATTSPSRAVTCLLACPHIESGGRGRKRWSERVSATKGGKVGDGGAKRASRITPVGGGSLPLYSPHPSMPSFHTVAPFSECTPVRAYVCVLSSPFSVANLLL